jgi:hypothetical protein
MRVNFWICIFAALLSCFVQAENDQSSSVTELVVPTSAAPEPSVISNTPLIKIKLGCAVPAKSPQFIMLEEIYRATFAQLGYELEMLSMPKLRVQSGLHQGALVGSCARIKLFEEIMQLDGLTRIPTSIGVQNIREYRLNKVQLKDEASLVVAFTRGERALDDILPLYLGEKIPVNSGVQGLKLLVSQRVDLYITNEISIFFALSVLDQELDLTSSHVKAIDNYPYLTGYFNDETKQKFALLFAENIKQRGGALTIHDFLSDEKIADLRSGKLDSTADLSLEEPDTTELIQKN